jgi:hypothetical protein
MTTNAKNWATFLILAVASCDLASGIGDQPPDVAIWPQDCGEWKRGAFVTSLDYSVAPPQVRVLPTEEWPEFVAPENINEAFDNPTAVWRTEGGYFASFDYGEFGGGLFFGTKRGGKWRRICGLHIQDVEPLGNERWIVAGGVLHGGNVILVNRRPNGSWKTRKIFSSEAGIPRIVGTCVLRSFIGMGEKRLIVFILGRNGETPDGKPTILGFYGLAGVFGVDGDGVIYYLGTRKPELLKDAVPNDQK